MRELENIVSKAKLSADPNSELNARDIANGLPIIVYTATPDGHVDWYNDWWYEYLDVPRGTPWDCAKLNPMHPEDVAKTNVLWYQTVREGKEFRMEQRFRRGSDGMYRWHVVRAIPVKDEDGKVIKYIGGNTDIHDQKLLAEELAQAKKQLEEKSQLLETILQQMPMSVVYAEAKSGKLVFANQQFKKVWRRDFIESEGSQGYKEYFGFHPDGSKYEGKDWPIAKVLATGKPIVNEDTDVILGDGTRGTLRINAAPVRNENNEVTGAIAITENVTDEINAKQELEKAKQAADAANNLKTAFLANMSHEIRTPIGVIQGFADLLSEQTLNDEQKRWVETIRRNTRQLTSLIGEILDLSKVEADKLEVESVPFKISDIADDIRTSMSLRAEDKGLALIVESEGNLPEFAVSDPTRVRQILINLVGNAIKFTEKGTVRVRFSRNSENQLQITVSDTGIGLPEAQQKKIFEPFVQADSSMTRKFGGTGLGLSISKKLAIALGGDLKLAQSAPGKGSTFEVTICCLREGLIKDRAQIALPNRVADFTNCRILVVDDSSDNRTLISRMLKDSGAIVANEPNGKLGLERALAEKFDAVLMDIQMPEMDGYQAIQVLRSSNYDRPVIALTAHALKDERERAMGLGFDAYITKPITKSSLFDTIGKLLEKH